MNSSNTQETYVSKNDLRIAMQQAFAFPEESRSRLSKYFIRYWSKEYFLRVTDLSPFTGSIPLEGKEFVIIYHKCTRGKILEMQGDTQLALSFRAAIPSLNLPAYVLVSTPLMPKYLEGDLQS